MADGSPNCARRRRSMHWTRWPKAGRLEADLAAGHCRCISRAAHRRAPHPDDRRPAGASPADRSGGARSRCQARRSAQTPASFLAGLAPHVEAVGHQFDGLVSEREERLSNDPDILRSGTGGDGFRRGGGGIPPDWRLALRPGPVAALAGGAVRVRSDAADADAGGRRWSRADPRAQPVRRHHRQIIERSEPLPLARSAAAAGRPAGADPGPCAAAGRAAGPAADPARRADRRVQLCPAARCGGAGRPVPRRSSASEPFDLALDRIRRMVGERRFALGVQLLAAHRDPIVIAEGYSDLAEAAIVAFAEAGEARVRANPRHACRAASWSCSASAGSAGGR